MGQREGAAGLTTHAPQAAQAVTLPASLDEAVAALAAMPAAVPVAGGTDLMASVNSGQLRPAALVGLGRISEIRGWQYQDGHALLGAGLTHARMGRPDFAALIPALAAAARAAGPPQIRNAGTLGGNIASASPTGDALPVLAALEATLIIAGPGGARREIPVSHLLAGMEMLRAGELIGYVRVPLLHAPQVFLKATGRTGPGRAIASVVARPRPRPARSAVRRGRHSADAAAAPGRRAVGRLADRLGQQPRDRARGAERLRGVRRRGLHPRPGARRGRLRTAAATRRTASAAHRRRAGPTSTGEGTFVTDDQHGEGTPQAGSRWDPLPQGDYDDGATAFVKLPEGGIDALLASDSPLAAPGHGYVPPPITVAPTTDAGTDPAGTGSWSVPHDGAQPQAVQWPDPNALPEEHRQAAQDAFAYNPGSTGQWTFDEPAQGGQNGQAAPGQDVTGQWSIPVADGDLPDESGEFTTSALVEQWGGTPPATLPGGAAAPWATESWAQQPASDGPSPAEEAVAHAEHGSVDHAEHVEHVEHVGARRSAPSTTPPR